ncbi:MAG TPA: LamB/YcsF family protein, partial [Erysipelotrichaceae bacterium]|nr:LamB/YcsF family protein [Erysipelotrichaceae bacterium]
AHGMTLQHVKPHGAIYNMAAKDKALAQAICQAVRDFDPSLIVLALPAGELYKTAQEMELRAAAEVFADRAYNEDGTLVSRSTQGSMITDAETAVSRVVRMVKEGKVTAITGKDIDIRADSVCIHGDGAHAVEFAKMIRKRLLKEQIEIVPLNEIV